MLIPALNTHLSTFSYKWKQNDIVYEHALDLKKPVHRNIDLILIWQTNIFHDTYTQSSYPSSSYL